MAKGNNDKIPTVLDFFNNQPDKDIDLLFRIVNLLCYHGQINELIELMVGGYPVISSSGNIIGIGIVEFFDRLALLKTIELLEKDSYTETDVNDLIIQLTSLEDGTLPEVVKTIISRLSGQVPVKWKAGDFDSNTGKKERRQNYYLLSLDFLRYLRVEHGIPFSKGELARQAVLECWLQQKRSKKRKDEASVLYPRERELDRCLAPLLDFLAPQKANMACVMECLPLLVLFLAEQGLIHDHHVKEVIEKLVDLQETATRYFKKQPLGEFFTRAIKDRWNLVLKSINSNSVVG